MKLAMMEGRREAEGQPVVVGMKMDAASRELLTWALVKVANAGDRVIALHVLPSAAEVTDSDGKPSSLISLGKAFDAVLAVYEGFCNLKQIDLKLKICRGSSIQKILVQEANSVSASKLILGVAKNSHVIGSSSTSVAKYCAKKLSPSCLVLAVNNGKIIFQKEATGNKNTHDLLLKCDSKKLQKINGHSAKNANLSGPSFPGLLTKSGQKSSFHRKESNATKISSLASLEKKDRPIHEPVCKPPCSPTAHTYSDPEKGRSLAIVPVKEHGSSLGCISVLIRELPDGRPGWPLLRKAFLNLKRSSSQEKPKSSMVQWATRLPGQYSASSMVHPYRRQARSDAASKNCFDKDIGTTVPVNFTFGVDADDEEKEFPKELLSLKEKYSSVCRLFSYKELEQATSYFSPANIIGKGGSSKVYKGCLSDGKEVAVKILKPSEGVLKDFISEIDIITKLHHKNVISLFGFCCDNNNLILVYNMLSRGSLDDNLHGIKGDKNDLGWDVRFKIAVGVAEALEYLHSSSGGKHPAIHRDVKSSNILLSDGFKPQLSDFGLAQWAASSPQNIENIACSDLAGTFGYLAPEYFMDGKIDEKVDIYAFGVVLLELISGRKSVCSSCSKGEMSLVLWAKPILLGGKLEQLVDPLLGSNYDSDEMERMCLAATLCIRQASHSRPSSDLAVKLLQGDSQALEWARAHLRASAESEGLNGEAGLANSSIQSHINLALLDIEDDAISTSSIDQSVNFITANTSLEDYLKMRCSRSSSFN